jgi:hypothetical protein
MINSKVARKWDDYNESIPLDIIEKYPELYGTLIRPSLFNPVRNTTEEFLFFNNVDYFRPAALAFEKSEEEARGTGMEPYYTAALPGTKAYKDYWREERRRCLQGYEPEVDDKPCGVRISGEYYFYLNYCRIGKAVKNKHTGEDTEEEGFPRFTSMDYYWFKELEKNENPPPGKEKRNMIAAKARRKGFSYKNAAGAVWKYTFFKNSTVVIASELGEKAKNTFDMALNMIDFLNQYTEFRSPWTNRRSSSTKCYIRAGVEVERNGKKYIKGRKSVIETVSLHNKPDAAAGLGATRIIFEEAGMIKDLKKAWGFTEPTLRSGKIRKGIGIIYGTGGDMEGATQDFADMFYDPGRYKLAGYENIFEETEVSGECGWFVDDMWFREGAHVTINGVKYDAVDKNGNALKWVAEIDLNQERMKGMQKDREAYNVEISQYCKTPAEAFLVTTGNIFPAAELFARLTELKSNDGFRLLGTNGFLVERNGRVLFQPDMEGILEPINRYPIAKSKRNLEGAIIQYEAPQEIDGELKPDAYIISVDPIGIDSDGGESLVAIYVLKTKKYAHIIGHDEIVMSYIGRPEYDPVDTTNRLLLKMSKYYNAKVTHENDRNAAAIRNFFIQEGEFNRLMRPPAAVVEKHITNSKTLLRKTGHSMGTDTLKEIAEIYTKKWLLEKRGVNPITGEEERNYDKIPDRRLLEELISYKRKGNFDAVSAFMGCIIQQEQMLHLWKTGPEEETENDPGEFFRQRMMYLPSVSQKQRELMIYEQKMKENERTKV